MADKGYTRKWLSACGEAGECVEVCFEGDVVFVRGSRDRHGPMLTFSADEWRAFCAAVAAGELGG
ncbi:DUF397 domain-containing protein [Rhizocola hellebori]|uniref:DUF397 domain-containing protein n=1 Tax=Rhizocola hellebori TaxID=1392758 RepID=UPI001940BA49|nr:DUF397 domain-containing protein [Rhizocola hellebori]